MALIAPSATEDPLAPVVGVPLRTVNVEGIAAEVPALLVDCFQYVLDHGLVEGIFRISGSVKRMRDVTADYSAYADWLHTTNPSPHDVLGVAKKFTRDYLHSIGGLFLPGVLPLLRALFVSAPRRNSLRSADSCRSTLTSYSLGLDSVLEEMEEPEYAGLVSPADRADALASLLVAKNSARKNAVFIYFLSVLKCVAAHQEETRMPSANLAIVFQQYLLETLVLAELQSYQSLLEFLIDHFDPFVAKYRLHLALVGGVEQLDPADSSSLSFSDPASSSPLTEYSLHQASPPKFSIYGSFEGRRRSSLSQRFTYFWEAYTTPANRPKRLSLISKSPGRSSERLALEHDSVKPQPLATSCTSVAQPLAEPRLKICMEISETSNILRTSVCSHEAEQLRVARNASKRKSFMGFLEAANDLGAPLRSLAKPRLLETEDLGFTIASSDSLVQIDAENSHLKLSKHSITRRFSLWLQKK